MPNIRDLAMSLISKNPQIANNPQTAEMIDAIKNNDSVKGQQIANNLLNSYGVSKQDAINQARGFFNL